MLPRSAARRETLEPTGKRSSGLNAENSSGLSPTLEYFLLTFLLIGRPIRFRLEERQYVIKAVLDQWYDPEGTFYEVRADDGNLYVLRQQTSTPERTWDLVSFRQAREER